MINKSRLKQENTDVRPYQVDNKTYLCEVTNGLNEFYYWQPTYGDGVEKTLKQPWRNKNKNETFFRTLFLRLFFLLQIQVQIKVFKYVWKMFASIFIFVEIQKLEYEIY